MTTATLPYDVVIIGAGLSGLSVAYRLHQAGCKILVLEAADTIGGVMQTFSIPTPKGPILLEAGPNTVPASSKEFLELAESVGLTPVQSTPSAQKRYLYTNGHLQALPNDPMSFLKSPLLSLPGKMALLQDLWKSPASDYDVSLARFVRHRFGQEILENVVTPAVTGIYAGDPEKISVRAAFPFLSEWEHSQGSVFKGAFQAFQQKKQEAALSKKKWSGLLSFEEGLGALPHAIYRAIGPDSLVCREAALSVEKTLSRNADEAQYRVVTSKRTVLAKQVILATPADISGALLQSHSDSLVKLLSDISYAPMNLVYIGFETASLGTAWDGFGFLVPRKQEKKPYVKLLGAIWNTALFPGRAPEGLSIATHFQGGAFYPEMSQLSDDDLFQRTMADLRQIYQQPDLMPVFSLVQRWPRAIPQYTMGHLERLHAIDLIMNEKLQGCHLLGNYRGGVSVNDCVKQANQLAKTVVQQLRAVPV